jgi:hypothetical protein
LLMMFLLKCPDDCQCEPSYMAARCRALPHRGSCGKDRAISRISLRQDSNSAA